MSNYRCKRSDDKFGHYRSVHFPVPHSFPGVFKLQRCHHSYTERYVPHFDVLQRFVLSFSPFPREESFFAQTSLGLAPKGIEEIYERINEIDHSGVTFVIVEQNARKALRAPHRGYVLDLGLNRLEDTGEGLLNNEEGKCLYLGLWTFLPLPDWD